MIRAITQVRNWETLQPDLRYFVPDLSPQARKALAGVDVKYVFVAESPHVSEVEPEKESERRPLCGTAGRQWWNMLTYLLRGTSSFDVSLERLIDFCVENKLAILNAVQYPLDPKIARKFSQAEPVKNLGFSKEAGPFSYKKLKTTQPVQIALESLRKRLNHPMLSRASIHCLGNDAQWFVDQALSDCSLIKERLGEKIPHPSAWWRREGLYGKIAKDKLSKIFKVNLN
jgi:hypothetical protein